MSIIPTTYGYVRVSTREQNGDRQLIAMREIPVPEENIFMDKQSGKDFDRPEYKKMVKKLKPDDLLYIKSIDRLERNYEVIQNRGPGHATTGHPARECRMPPSTFEDQAKIHEKARFS